MYSAGYLFQSTLWFYDNFRHFRNESYGCEYVELRDAIDEQCKTLHVNISFMPQSHGPYKHFSTCAPHTKKAKFLFWTRIETFFLSTIHKRSHIVAKLKCEIRRFLKLFAHQLHNPHWLVRLVFFIARRGDFFPSIKWSAEPDNRKWNAPSLHPEPNKLWAAEAAFLRLFAWYAFCIWQILSAHHRHYGPCVYIAFVFARYLYSLLANTFIFCNSFIVLRTHFLWKAEGGGRTR